MQCCYALIYIADLHPGNASLSTFVLDVFMGRVEHDAPLTFQSGTDLLIHLWPHSSIAGGGRGTGSGPKLPIVNGWCRQKALLSGLHVAAQKVS